MRLLTYVVVAVLSTVFGASMVAAETTTDPPPTSPAPGTLEDDEIGTQVGTPTPPPKPPTTGTNDNDNNNNNDRPCSYHRWNVQKVVNGITYTSYSRECPGPNGSRIRHFFWFADIDPTAVAESAWDQDKAKVPKPSLGLSPPITNLIVKFDTWIWTDPADFAPVTVTSLVTTLNGPLSATVTAEPLRLVFDPGEPDSQPMICEGPGQQWFPIYGDDAESGCMYAYQHSSQIDPTGTFTASWSIVWRVTWTSNNGASGVLAEEYLTTTQQPMTVKEVQVLITG